MADNKKHVIRILEEALEQAKAGHITSIALAVAGPETQIGASEASYSGDQHELGLIRIQLGALAANIDKIGIELAETRRIAFQNSLLVPTRKR